MKVCFYVAYPYYFPHFLPIGKELEKNNHQVTYVLSDKQNSELMKEIAESNNLNYLMGKEILFTIETDIMFFANNFSEIDKINAKTIFMDHGVGTKACDYGTALERNDLVLVEGDYRFNTLLQDFPKSKNKLKKVGFSKLDEVINFSKEEKEKYILKYNIDITKPTILYAPTFFPSSIEKMSKSFPEDFKECNIIVKPHYLSLHRKKYRKQQAQFKRWSTYENCSICDASEYNLVPFLALCDVMISDESSAIFEFTALDKPVILNRFLKLRWSYYLNPKKLLKRLDSNIDQYREIGDNAESYEQMVNMVYDNLKNREKYQTIRKKFTYDICGEVDGKVSQRIVKELEELHQMENR